MDFERLLLDVHGFIWLLMGLYGLSGGLWLDFGLPFIIFLWISVV